MIFLSMIFLTVCTGTAYVPSYAFKNFYRSNVSSFISMPKPTSSIINVSDKQTVPEKNEQKQVQQVGNVVQHEKSAGPDNKTLKKQIKEQAAQARMRAELALLKSMKAELDAEEGKEGTEGGEHTAGTIKKTESMFDLKKIGSNITKNSGSAFEKMLIKHCALSTSLYLLNTVIPGQPLGQMTLLDFFMFRYWQAPVNGSSYPYRLVNYLLRCLLPF